jgi:hypothetical protein
MYLDQVRCVYTGQVDEWMTAWCPLHVMGSGWVLLVYAYHPSVLVVHVCLCDFMDLSNYCTYPLDEIMRWFTKNKISLVSSCPYPPPTVWFATRNMFADAAFRLWLSIRLQIKIHFLYISYQDDVYWLTNTLCTILYYDLLNMYLLVQAS